MYLKTSDQPELDLGFYKCSCNWGMHIAGLYETQQEHDEIIMGFLHRGVLDGDLQLYCPVERSAEHFTARFTEAFPELSTKVTDPEVFQLSGARDLYYPQGTFSPVAMDEGLSAFYEQSQASGPRNIRATADMVWALEAIPGVEHLMAYEARLNYFIPNKPWVSICMYNINKFPASTIMGVLKTHPYTIISGSIMANPFYQDPGTWLLQNAPEFLPAAKGLIDASG